METDSGWRHRSYDEVVVEWLSVGTDWPVCPLSRSHATDAAAQSVQSRRCQLAQCHRIMASDSGIDSMSSPEVEEAPMSRTHQYRHHIKPLLERKRRARINKCVDELKVGSE